MIYETLNKKIADAMVQEKDAPTKKLTNLWRAIKTEMVNATHQGVILPNDEAETRILRAMVKQRHNAAQEFAKAGPDNVNAVANRITNEWEAGEIEKLLPQAPNPEDVKKETMCVIKTFVEFKAIEDPNFNPNQLQRYTKDIISKVKEKFPLAENGIIAGCVKNYIS